MTQRQPVPESSSWISRGMGRVLEKARTYLLLLPRQEPARADERVTIGSPQKRLSMRRLHPNS